MPRSNLFVFFLSTFSPLFVVAACALAQPQSDPAVGREAMAKLFNLVGRWEGEATVHLGPGKSHKVRQTEHVQSKLGGNVLLIEGTGYEKSADGPEIVVFQALAVCAYDPISKSYSFHAFRDNGMSKVCSAELTNTGLTWGFEDGRGGKIRYTISLAGDTWSELGEYIADGQPSRKIFEMTVKRIAEKVK
jgi:hypothetical protein